MHAQFVWEDFLAARDQHFEQPAIVHARHLPRMSQVSDNRNLFRAWPKGANDYAAGTRMCTQDRMGIEVVQRDEALEVHLCDLHGLSDRRRIIPQGAPLGDSTSRIC